MANKIKLHGARRRIPAGRRQNARDVAIRIRNLVVDEVIEDEVINDEIQDNEVLLRNLANELLNSNVVLDMTVITEEEFDRIMRNVRELNQILDTL